MNVKYIILNNDSKRLMGNKTFFLINRKSNQKVRNISGDIIVQLPRLKYDALSIIEVI